MVRWMVIRLMTSDQVMLRDASRLQCSVRQDLRPSGAPAADRAGDRAPRRGSAGAGRSGLPTATWSQDRSSWRRRPPASVAPSGRPPLVSPSRPAAATAGRLMTEPHSGREDEHV